MGVYKANTHIKYENEEVGIWLDELNKNKMLGKTLGKLLDNAYYSNNKEDLLGNAGVVANKVNKAYHDDLTEKVNTLQTKIKAIHSMCIDLKTMALVGKRLELESRVENIEISTYVLNRQISQLCNILGIEVSDFKFEKMNTLDVCDIVDKVIDSYGSMLSTLKVSNISTIDLGVINNTETVIDLDDNTKKVEQESSKATTTISNESPTREEQGLADITLEDIAKLEFIDEF